jgi:hypothetical protein
MGTEAIQGIAGQEPSISGGLLPGSKRTLPTGVITNITSGAAMFGIANLAAYCTSKHDALGMTRAWAENWPNLFKYEAVSSLSNRYGIVILTFFRNDRYATCLRGRHDQRK